MAAQNHVYSCSSDTCRKCPVWGCDAVFRSSQCMELRQEFGLDEAQDEVLYLVNGATYLHIQISSDGAYDYSLYDAGSKQLIDGGVVDAEDVASMPMQSDWACARYAICQLEGIVIETLESADLDILEDFV